MLQLASAGLIVLTASSCRLLLAVLDCLSTLLCYGSCYTSVLCGTAEDQRELQVILRSKTIESGLDGSTVDLMSPSPRRSHVPFCGEACDAAELQAILATSAATVHGQVIDLLEDTAVGTSSPPRKRQALQDHFDEFELLQATQQSLNSLRSIGMGASVAGFEARVAAGMSAPSQPPSDVEFAGDIEANSHFGYGSTFDAP